MVRRVLFPRNRTSRTCGGRTMQCNLDAASTSRVEHHVGQRLGRRPGCETPHQESHHLTSEGVCFGGPRALLRGSGFLDPVLGSGHSLWWHGDCGMDEMAILRQDGGAIAKRREGLMSVWMEQMRRLTTDRPASWTAGRRRRVEGANWTSRKQQHDSCTIVINETVMQQSRSAGGQITAVESPVLSTLLNNNPRHCSSPALTPLVPRLTATEQNLLRAKRSTKRAATPHASPAS